MKKLGALVKSSDGRHVLVETALQRTLSLEAAAERDPGCSFPGVVPGPLLSCLARWLAGLTLEARGRAEASKPVPQPTGAGAEVELGSFTSYLPITSRASLAFADKSAPRELSSMTLPPGPIAWPDDLRHILVLI